ncbi:MAG: HEAT repeat domain-containing protein [Candidatus Heimdallarchaeota archaeon]|nr:HEAT repeat domain-containing protein [Candidatus Heimdallarchaeota archaeon]
MKVEKNEIEKLLAVAQQREEINGDERNIEDIITAINGLFVFIKQKSKVTKDEDVDLIKKIKDATINILQKRKNLSVLKEALQVLIIGSKVFLEISNEREIDEIKIALARTIKQGDVSIRKLAVKTFIVYIRDDLTSDNEEKQKKSLKKLEWLLECEPDQIGDLLDRIMELMKDNSWVIRRFAVSILKIAGKGTKEEIDLLIKCLNDEKPEVQCRVAKIIAELGKKGNQYVDKAIKPLEQELKKPKSKDTQFHFAYALAQIQQTKKGTGYKELVNMDEEGLLTGARLSKFEQLYYKTPKEKLKQKYDELLKIKEKTKKGKALEDFCEIFFNQIEGFEITRDFRLGDQQIDIKIDNNTSDAKFWSIVNSPIIYVECKYHEGVISTNDLGWFVMKMEKQPLVKIGFFIALNGFSSECHKTLRDARVKGKTIGIIEKKDFEEFINESITYLKFLENIVKRTMNY